MSDELLVIFLVVLVSVLTGLLAYLFIDKIIFFGLIGLLIFAGSMSRIPERFSRQSLGFELGVFITVCFSMALGIWSIIIGILITLGAAILIKEPPQDTLVALIAIAITALGASLVSIQSIVITGVLFTLVYDAVCFVLYTSTGHSILGSIRFTAGHLIWNYVVFRALGSCLVGIIQTATQSPL